jgi:tRNA pseudouridine13 synthase
MSSTDSPKHQPPAPEKLRFSWRELPAITAHLPGTGGEARAELEDFVVTEIPSYLPSGAGEHAYALVEKRGLATRDLIVALRQMGVPEREVGVAGQKDKHAVTRQWLSAPARYASCLEALNDIEGVRVLSISRHRNKLHVGHLRGNRFEVRIRRPEPNWEPHAQGILTHLSSAGLPNYFGPQRFGRFNTNAAEGMQVLRGEDVPGGRGLHRFFINALQAMVFNWMLKRRIEQGLFARVLAGDMAQKHDTGGMFLAEDAELESPRAGRLEISATLPLYGRQVRLSPGDAGALEREALDYFGASWSDFSTLRGDRRISRVKPSDVSLEPTEDGYIVRFTLPSGVYATCLLRELTKVERAADPSSLIPL